MEDLRDSMTQWHCTYRRVMRQQQWSHLGTMKVGLDLRSVHAASRNTRHSYLGSYNLTDEPGEGSFGLYGKRFDSLMSKLPTSQVSRDLKFDEAPSIEVHPPRAFANNCLVISRATTEIAFSVKSTPRFLSSHKSSKSLSTISTDQQAHISRSNSRKNRKAVALPALQYAQPTTLGSNFLLDQSQWPPGRKPSPARSPTQSEGTERLLRSRDAEPLSPASVDTVASAVSISRQETLARLIGTDHSAFEALPSILHEKNKTPLPKIRISSHRRSRSENTLNVARLDIPLTDYGASRSRSVHDLRHKTTATGVEKSQGSISDLSDDGFDEEGASMWWRNLGNISPQPFCQ
jgi:hypothetical protein